MLAAAAEPDWSADGRVAFTSGPDIYNGRSDIYAGPPAGPFRRLTFRGGSAPSWSPHGRWIAFARKGTVYVVPSRGGKARRVVAASKGWPASHLTHTVSPVRSPDGKRVAFHRAIERGADTYLDLYSVDWRTKKLRRVAKGLTSDGTYDDSAVDRLVWQALP